MDYSHQIPNNNDEEEQKDLDLNKQYEVFKREVEQFLNEFESGVKAHQIDSDQISENLRIY